MLGTLLVVDVGFAFLARLVPSLNPFAAQFSVKILAGLFAVSVSLPLTITIVGDRLTTCSRRRASRTVGRAGHDHAFGHMQERLRSVSGMPMKRAEGREECGPKR